MFRDSRLSRRLDRGGDREETATASTAAAATAKRQRLSRRLAIVSSSRPLRRLSCRLGLAAGKSKAGGVMEVEDRLSSFRRGVTPTLWPSLDSIHYYPARYFNFYRMLQQYIDKKLPDHALYVALRGSRGLSGSIARN